MGISWYNTCLLLNKMDNFYQEISTTLRTHAMNDRSLSVLPHTDEIKMYNDLKRPCSVCERVAKRKSTAKAVPFPFMERITSLRLRRAPGKRGSDAWAGYDPG